MRGVLTGWVLVCAAVCAAAETIPIRVQRGLIMVEATVAGASRPLHVVLDSGAEETVLARRTADSLGVPLISREPVRRVDGIDTACRAAPVPLRLGGRDLFTKSLLVIDLRRESRLLGTRIDGLLGADILDRRVLRIDYRRQLLDLAPGPSPAQGAVILPMSRNFGAWCVPVTAAGMRLGKVRVDTGSTKALCWAAPADGAVAPPRRSGMKVSTSVALGSLVFPDLATHLYRNRLFPGEHGLLGTGLLEKFDAVWIDTVRNRLVLESR